MLALGCPGSLNSCPQSQLSISKPRAIESTVGELTLFFDQASSALWIGGDSQGKLPASTELLGYGSGEIQDGPTATDLISDPSGRWFVYELSTLAAQIIVEADRKLPFKIRSLPVFQKANDFEDGTPPTQNYFAMVSLTSYP